MSLPDPTPSADSPLDRGIAAAFARRAQPGVLEALSVRGHSKLGLHLPPAGPEERPALRVANQATADSLRNPRYQILGEIARGGVGLVYQARDVDLGRDVAMKVLRPEYQDHAEVVERFVGEAQIGGQLQHPGIVPVYEFGLNQSAQPFFAMKLVQGRTLASLLRARGEPQADRRRFLATFEQVCQTVAYAHARRVVHRDLKPSNVMVGSFGEVQVVDWGFAKVLLAGGIADEQGTARRGPAEPRLDTVRTRQGSSHSVAGSVFGTPAYMPPEQARGELERMDERSDVFSLGAILCEILTGEPPYAESDGDALELARRADATRALARLARSGAPAELTSLSRECLAADPAARPASARVVAERIGAHLAAAEERARAARNRLRTTLSVGATLLVALAVGGYAYVRTRSAADERRERASGLVVAALQDARSSHGRALERGDDAQAWDAALHGAQKAAALAAAPDVPDQLAQGASVSLSEIAAGAGAARRVREQAARDAALLARLLELRLPPDDNLERTGWALEEARRLDQAYASAFAQYGLDADAQESTPVPAVEPNSSFAIQVAAALDHWGIELRQLAESGSSQGASPEQLARTLDDARRRHVLAARLDHGDAWRGRLRAACVSDRLELEILRELAAAARVDEQPALHLLSLAAALSLVGGDEDARALLRRAQAAHPGDVGLALQLGLSLERAGPEAGTEAFALYRIAHALRPDMKETRHRGAHALAQAGDLERAAQLFEELAAEEARHLWFHHAGIARDNLDQPTAAARHFRAALACGPEPWDPAMRQARHGLARVQARTGEVDAAIAELRTLLAEDPGGAKYHFALAMALQRKAEVLRLPSGPERLQHPLVAEALSNYRRAAELDPATLDAHYNLGNELLEAGAHDAAIEEYRSEIERHPAHAGAHNNLGLALWRSRRVPEAVEAYRALVALEPDHLFGWINLGSGLNALGRNDEAFEALQHALRLAPDNASAHWNLARVHEDRGDWEQAVAEWERCARIDPDLSSLQQRLERARDTLARSRAWTTWIEDPASAEAAPAAELAEAASFAYTKRKFRRAAELSAAVLQRIGEEQPSMQATSLYDGACSAVLAASGAGVDSADLSGAEQSRLRSTACGWLERRFAQLDASPDRADMVRRLGRWLQDEDFAAVREPAALIRLPEAEAARWSRLWSEVVRRLAAERGT